MKKIALLVCLLAMVASPVAAQGSAAAGAGAGKGTGSGSGGEQTKTTSTSTEKSSSTTKVNDPWARFVTTLTNVQIEVTLTDQLGTQTPEKKTVSMIVASRNWGKVRSSATVMPPGEAPYAVQLNVDARPLVSIEGPIQVELTLEYAPIRTGADPKDKRPTGINQSQTVILQSGKPLIVAQAADPVSDRKVVVEVKATILK
jgi:hypothetical protein